MVTYAQLQSESWWGREITTPEIDWLGDELCRRTKRPRGAFGTKGDNDHLRGAHRSQEWILKSRYCTSRTYTVQSGLSAVQQRHVAGVDFTPGSAAQMVAQCKRIYAALRAGQLEEVREFYGNVDGDKVVDGWDNVRNRTASSDSSHLWHWHLTLDRRHCTNRKLMERILAVVLGDPTEEEDEMSRRDALLGVYDYMQAATTGKPAGDYGMADSTARQAQKHVTALLEPFASQLAVIQANQQAMLGKDWVNEQQIIDGVLNGLGSKDLDDAATALRAAFGDRLPELLAKLAVS